MTFITPVASKFGKYKVEYSYRAKSDARGGNDLDKNEKFALMIGIDTRLENLRCGLACDRHWYRIEKTSCIQLGNYPSPLNGCSTVLHELGDWGLKRNNVSPECKTRWNRFRMDEYA